ncbi:unnamed protein product [Medioppia subpectinata]|uniref:Ras GTPase-activating protein n=1 Tax=Medioppia subpectinata TaxID=1979941 RepID=A0A7R9KZL5_9ACAR|nr:unnamed protein product [Medioppia subpectinata]CAG2112838.1 unnamed protein product [Medioppia subpectinata]
MSEESSLPDLSAAFHGLIERREAEQRLLTSGLEDCFLLRESSSRASNQKWFVLSFLGRKSGVNHFRVQHFCQHFYIGSKAFPSLQKLITFYHFSDLLRGERLQNPVPPPEPVVETSAPVRRLVAVLPYSKIPDSDELSFKKGDVFVVHNDLQNGWLWCTNDRTLENGLVFGELLEQLDESCDENESHEWFHSKISKEEAVERLARAGVGAFLVRPSDNSPGNYSLFFHLGTSVQRFRIERRGERYVMGGRVFRSLDDVIQRYKLEQIVEGFRLERAVKKHAFEEHRWSHVTKERLDDDSNAIYQTLRESREAAKTTAIAVSGFLLKKSQKHKKWKQLWFALNSKDRALYYYAGERRTRPKGIVDLNYSYVYGCHDSLFDKQHCFQVVERALPCLSTVYYLCAKEADVARQWVRAVHSLCAQQSVTSAEVTWREMRSLFICLIEGQNLPLKCAPNPYVEIQFNGGVKCARTSVKCPPNPIWEEEFQLEDIPADVTHFSFTLYNKAKRQKDTEIAELSLPLSSLATNAELEDWFPLSGVAFTPRGDSWGQLLARVRLTRELILSFSEYSALKDLLLLADDLEVIAVCEHFCSRDRQPLAAAKSFHGLLLVREGGGRRAPMGSRRALAVRAAERDVSGGQNLPLKCAPNPYVEIQFNGGVKCARTSVKCPPNPIWEEEFQLEDIPADVTHFSFTLYNKAKRQKDTEIAELSLPLSSLATNAELEDWFPLSGVAFTPRGDSWGQLLARVRLTRELILSFSEYSALKDLLLLADDLEVIAVCEHFCSRDRQPLAAAILKVARFERKECELLKAMIEREIGAETDVSTLMRANSLTSATIELYARSLSQQFIRHSLLEPILKILDSKNSCELNPARLDSPQDACHNAEHLLEVLDAFVDHVFQNGAHCPPQLRYICGCLQRAVMRKWPADILVRSRVVSGFVFLRLICPAILNPRNFSLITEIPSDTASRTLILIAKCVQNLANLVEFGSKSIFITADRFEPPPPPNSKREPWMEIVNPFILKNKSKMIKYLDDLSSNQMPATHWSPQREPHVTEAPARELALIHSICDLHLDSIQEMSAQKPTLRKLALVVELLRKRKQRIANNK